jgi:branched-chain amino acid transport system permease protein
VGAVLGSVVMTVLRSVLSNYTTHYLIVIGALFVAVVLFMPQGLIGWVRPRLAQRLERKARS